MEYLPYVIVVVVIIGAMIITNAWRDKKRSRDNDSKGN